MKPFLAFIRKEIAEQLRAGRLVILGVIFVLLGVMNPAVAKLTPWLMKMMADSLAEAGMTVAAAEPTAADSWAQFFKNMPMGLIAFVLVEFGIFTREYESGTLVLSLTKGLSRRSVVIAKAAVLGAVWSLCFWLSTGVTWAYTEYFWDCQALRSLPAALLCWWLFGLWIQALTVFFSAVSRSGTGVLAGTGGAVFLCLLLGMIPRVGRYLPTALTEGYPVILGAAETDVFTAPALIAAAVSAACVGAALAVFNRRQIG